jgi:predicted nucleic acid-binding protein
MLVIIDCNKLFSALLSKGTIFEVFLLNKELNKIKFIAPEFLFFEIGRNLGEIVKRSKLSNDELSKIFKVMKEQIELIPFEEFNKFTDEARKLAPHKKDIQYFALSLFSKGGIWSDEKSFRKQSQIEIISTGRLLKFLKE